MKNKIYMIVLLLIMSFGVAGHDNHTRHYNDNNSYNVYHSDRAYYPQRHIKPKYHYHRHNRYRCYERHEIVYHRPVYRGTDYRNYRSRDYVRGSVQIDNFRIEYRRYRGN